MIRASSITSHHDAAPARQRRLALRLRELMDASMAIAGARTVPDILCKIADQARRLIGAEQAPRGKPFPDLFLAAVHRLQVPKEAAIVFEDSPNGVKAANRAGIFVVAVPNGVTSLLSLEGADLILGSLKELSLPELLDKVK